MKPTCVSACVFAVAASLAGCMGTGDVEYAGEVSVTSPELVTVSPGVQVIADADEPLFYSHGQYWLYRDGYWFRSDYYRSGFARVDSVYLPGELRVIERPQLYVQYRRHLGRDRFARPPQQQTRTPTYQTPTYEQTTPPPTYPSQSPTYPAQPSYPDNYHPNQPVVPGQTPRGINPTTTPPMTTTPNDNRREPYPQRAVPPDIDRTVPPGQANRPEPPGKVNRPDDRGNPNAPGRDRDDRDRQQVRPGNANPPAQTDRPDDRGPKNDRDDRGPAPGQGKPDKDKGKNKKNDKD